MKKYPDGDSVSDALLSGRASNTELLTLHNASRELNNKPDVDYTDEYIYEEDVYGNKD